MKTQSVDGVEPPEQLVKEVRRLKEYFPYRICWGAFNPNDPNETDQGAHATKRQFNKRLREGWVGFIL